MADSGTTTFSMFLATGKSAARSAAGAVALLVARFRRGDSAAFGELYGMYSPMVHGIVLSIVRHDDVDDIVQDVFLTAYESLDSLREDAAFGGWLAAIARNKARQSGRYNGRLEALSDDHSEMFSRSDDSKNAAREVLDAIRELPDSYRETLVLRLVEGLTGPEIAALTDLTPESVRVNLHRGMKMLREKLGVE